jgi:Fic family protein
MPNAPDKPFNALPKLPPQSNLETVPILKRTISAARALAELKQAGRQIPNQAVLVNTIPLLEAQVSSEIEHVVTTTDNLLRLSSDENSVMDPASKEAYRYVAALRQGYQAIHERPVCTATAIDICRTIRNIDMDIRAVPGTAIATSTSKKIIYTPPEGKERIRDLLANWGHYINEETDIDPLIRMAVMHYQFEAIHPFTDGNGRTGRILNILFLIQEELLDIPVLYLSRYILNSRTEYYQRLRAVTEDEEWEPWILYMLEAVEETAAWTSQRITAILGLLRHTRHYIRGKLPRIYSRELAEQLFTHPYVQISHLIDTGIAQRQTASRYLHQLADIGILKEMKIGRKKFFVHTKFLNLLLSDHDDFEKYDS